MTRTKLSVNLNKVALLRNSRTLGIPSVTRCAAIALDAGAQGITVHPRPDERHIRVHDVFELAQLVAQRPDVEFNIEGNPFHNLVDFARRVRPHQCTLVPDEQNAFTSDHGWDLPKDNARLAPVISELKGLGVRVSLFVDPTIDVMQQARGIGADRVELYTEPYARSFGSVAQADELARYAAAARAATQVGLGINAGHDLNQLNLPSFLAQVPNVLEVSIGHALTADALELGLASTVRAYLQAIAGGNAAARSETAR
jgi:pyridoxine 5-phosphate synthase